MRASRDDRPEPELGLPQDPVGLQEKRGVLTPLGEREELLP